MLTIADRLVPTTWEEAILHQYPATVATSYFLTQMQAITVILSLDGAAMLARIFNALSRAIEQDSLDIQSAGLVAPELIIVAGVVNACKDFAIRLKAITVAGSATVTLDKDAQNALQQFESVDPTRDEVPTFNTVRAAINLVYGVTVG